LAAYNKSQKTQLDQYNLHGDAQLIVIAGSDSVAATLTHVLFELAWHPETARELQEAFDALPSLAHDNLTTVPLLDAVIHETMRLHPPVPSGTQRMTPPEGLVIGDVHIPGNTIVQVPSYTVFRGASCIRTKDLSAIARSWMLTLQGRIKRRAELRATRRVHP